MHGPGTLHTLDASLKKGLAALAGPHAVVVAGSVVTAHGTETHVFGHLVTTGAGRGPRLPHAERVVAGAALILSGNWLPTGQDT